MRARRFVLALSALVQFTGDPATAQQSQQQPSVIVDAQTIVDLADTLTRRGQWSEARDAWQSVLSANPSGLSSPRKRQSKARKGQSITSRLRRGAREEIVE